MLLSRRHFLRASAAAGAGFLGLRRLPAQDRSARAPGRLELFVEPNDDTLLENCDNLTVAP